MMLSSASYRPPVPASALPAPDRSGRWVSRLRPTVQCDRDCMRCWPDSGGAQGTSLRTHVYEPLIPDLESPVALLPLLLVIDGVRLGPEAQRLAGRGEGFLDASVAAVADDDIRPGPPDQAAQ